METKLPDSTRAKGLVKLIGLNVDTKDTHKVVWGALTENREADAQPLTYKLVPQAVTPEGEGEADPLSSSSKTLPDPVFPTRKPKVRTGHSDAPSCNRTPPHPLASRGERWCPLPIRCVCPKGTSVP